MTYFVCLLLLLSSAAAIDISFSNYTYYSEVAPFEDPIGKVVTETQLVYNQSLVKNFTTKDYNLYQTDAKYFSVDNAGIIRLNAILPYREIYRFAITLLYTVTLTDDTTESGFLTAYVRVQALGPVHFDFSAYHITVSVNLQPTEKVYDFSQHIVYNKSAFQNVYIEFDYVNTPYYSMEASTGVLYTQRALSPGGVAVRIEIEYDVTLKNGTVISDSAYAYAIIAAIGCRGEEEIKAFWPETYPCSAYRVPCSELDNGYYFSDGFATRVCNANGNWLPPDYSNCSVKAGVESFGLIWMTFATSSGYYILSRLDNIKNDIANLFPADSVSNIYPVTGFPSNAQWGFMLGFKMDVNSSRLSGNDIRNAQSALRRAYRFGSIILISRTIIGRGLRLFKGTDSHCGPQEATDAKYFEVCSGKECSCGNTTINNVGSCDSVELRRKEEDRIATTPHNKSEPSYLILNASDYYGYISSFVPKGTYILTVGFNISGNSVANISNYYYDLSGFYSDFLKIDRRRGHVTLNAEITRFTYSFDVTVSFFYTVTYTNGTVGHNYTASNIFITAYAGIRFNASLYYITVDANYTINETVLITMSKFLIYDDKFNLDRQYFTHTSDIRFSINSAGDLKIVRHLDPLHTHYVNVYLEYNGTTTTTNKHYRFRIKASVQIYTLGCLEEESGSVVWPASHVCTTAVHNCYEIDHAFNQSGVVTRYCSNTGEWQDPDFSQCLLKPETKPFVHLYFTFYTLSQSHILVNLQSIINSGYDLLSSLDVNYLTPYYIKESVIRYGMVVVLRGEATPNDAILTSINNTISQYRSFARLRLQTIGNGIRGFTTSKKCEYPSYSTNAWNITKFTAVCQKGDNVFCDCDLLTPTVGICNSSSVPTTTAPTSVGFNVSTTSVTNTSIGLQWTDDTPGIIEFKVQYSAVIPYNTTMGEASYMDTKEVTTTDTSYMFTLLTPSTDYTFTVTSYNKDSEYSTITISQATMEGRKENPSFVELRFSSKQDCTKWEKESKLVSEMVDAVVSSILPYCKCQYISEYIKVWYVKCLRNNDGTSDIILIAQLMSTNLLDASYVMQAMSKWVVSSGIPGVIIDGEVLRIDQNCKVQIEHPYGRNCIELLTTGAPMSVRTDNDNNDNSSAGAAIGGVIAGLVIICITIVVLVVVVMLLRRREKQRTRKAEIPSSSYNAETMKVQLSGNF